MPRRSRSRSRSPRRFAVKEPLREERQSRDLDRRRQERRPEEVKRKREEEEGSVFRHQSDSRLARRECDSRKPSRYDNSEDGPRLNGRNDRRSLADDGDRKPSFDDDRKPRVDDDRKPRFDDDRKPRFDDDRKPRFDDDRKPRFDDDRKPSFDYDRKPRIHDERERRRRVADEGDRRPRRDEGGGRRRRRDDGGGGKFEWGKADQRKDTSEEQEKPKEKANMGLSGKLAEDTNMYKGVLIKYSEPANARIPKKRWRLYPFKGEEALKPLYVHRQSGFLIGRDRKIADIPFDHPSISKQHAVLQYRQVEVEQPDGSKSRLIKPYIIDLESANGTFLNGSRIDARRYVELKERDVLKFGYSTREYVVLSETTDQDAAGDLVPSSDSESEEDS